MFTSVPTAVLPVVHLYAGAIQYFKASPSAAGIQFA